MSKWWEGLVKKEAHTWEVPGDCGAWWSLLPHPWVISVSLNCADTRKQTTRCPPPHTLERTGKNKMPPCTYQNTHSPNRQYLVPEGPAHMLTTGDCERVQSQMMVGRFCTSPDTLILHRTTGIFSGMSNGLSIGSEPQEKHPELQTLWDSCFLQFVTWLQRGVWGLIFVNDNVYLVTISKVKPACEVCIPECIENTCPHKNLHTASQQWRVFSSDEQTPRGRMGALHRTDIGWLFRVLYLVIADLFNFILTLLWGDRGSF